MVEVPLPGGERIMGPLHCPLCLGLGVVCLLRTGALALTLFRLA